MNRRYKGFTLIEMLTAMGIIALLVGIGVLAYEKVTKSAAHGVTATTLGTAKTLLAEYDAKVGIRNLGMPAAQGGDWDYSVRFPSPQGFVSSQPSQDGGGTLGGPFSAIGGPKNSTSIKIPTGTVTSDIRTNLLEVQGKPPTDPKVANNALYNTQLVMADINRVPSVSQLIGKLPAKQLMSVDGHLIDPNWNGPAPSAVHVAQGMGAAPTPAPVLLDAWGNPIIFVPAGGLLTQFANGNWYIVRTSGLKPVTTPDPLAGGPPAPTDHPFWASAGPDGDFSRGDDNLYSFQEQ